MTSQKGSRHECELEQPEQERPRGRQKLTFCHLNGAVPMGGRDVFRRAKLCNGQKRRRCLHAVKPGIRCSN